jgi:hypothetical protein
LDACALLEGHNYDSRRIYEISGTAGLVVGDHRTAANFVPVNTADNGCTSG